MNRCDLIERLDYNPSTGCFRWKVDTKSGKRAGDIAGSIEVNGYRVIRIGGRLYKGHRIAWMMVHGKLPDGEIDHIDGNRENNAIDYLRDVSRRINSWNRHGSNRNNGSRLLGVSSHSSGKFHARICRNGRSIHLGLFATAEQAHEAYIAAKNSIDNRNLKGTTK